MARISTTKGHFILNAYRGDRKTLLAFNFDGEDATAHLAGFTIHVTPPGVHGYYLLNDLQFEHPEHHAIDPAEPTTSTLNAPIHKFRWLHVPGSAHQGLEPATGDYVYVVTPRYFDDDQSMQPLNPKLSATVTVLVDGFEHGRLAVGFTRGFVQSQAFLDHFGKKAIIRPKGDDILFDTSQIAGTNATGTDFTYEEAYEWLGFTARGLIHDVLDEAIADASCKVDAFAYDLNEPGIVGRLKTLAKAGRLRLILDDAALHHNEAKPEREDMVEVLLDDAAGGKIVKRGNFARYAHDKVFVLHDANGARKVLTGSTNFSLTGVYVNSNHVLVFDDREVAGWYSGVFQSAWEDEVGRGPFLATDWSSKRFTPTSNDLPRTEITFAPHAPAFADTLLDEIVDRITEEGDKPPGKASVLFAVMAINDDANVVYKALNHVHETAPIFSYGISDEPGGIKLYSLGDRSGVIVSGKPRQSVLPPPFSQVPGVTGHQVHHKFVVCGFNTPEAVVYCGSSNLAGGGEKANGDNLIAIRDEDVATVFAIEALGLVDHFDFLNRYAEKARAEHEAVPHTLVSRKVAAKSVSWHISTTDGWVRKYYDPNDLHFLDRKLFC